MDYLNLLAISFPKGSGITAIVFGLLKWLYNGIGTYGIAIIIFTLILKLAMLPLDFGNKYFTKVNSMKMAEFKPEEDKLKQIYASDPLALNRARNELYKKYGYSQGGFCLFMVINLILTLVIFLSVYNGLRSVSSHNLRDQYSQLHTTYMQYTTTNPNGFSEEDFTAEINHIYKDTAPGFLWVKNIWKPDSWSSPVPSYEEYKTAFSDDSRSEEEKIQEYNYVFERIDMDNGWNGLLLLVLLAGASTYFSSVLNTKALQKKTAENKPKEEIIQYSARDAKSTNDPTVPQINPAAMGNIMKFVLPIIMIFFTLNSTAALALYIIMNSVISTLFGLGINVIVDQIIKKKKQKENANKPTNIINPHAKYFKR